MVQMVVVYIQLQVVPILVLIEWVQGTPAFEIQEFDMTPMNFPFILSLKENHLIISHLSTSEIGASYPPMYISLMVLTAMWAYGRAHVGFLEWYRS